MLIADPGGGGLFVIADFRAFGAFIRAADKGPGSVDYGIKWLQGLRHIYIDKKHCPETWKEFVEGKHYNGDIRIHTDGEDKDCILEIKTTSQIHENVDDYKVYLVQLLFYMQNVNVEHGLLPAKSIPAE